MQVRLPSNVVVEHLAPIGLERDPRPVPEFWAKSDKELIERGFDRFAAAYGWRYRPNVTNRQYQAKDFGWGDAGLGSIVVYERVGAVGAISQGKETTWTFYLYYGHDRKAVLQFVTKLNDVERAKAIVVEFFHAKGPLVVQQ